MTAKINRAFVFPGQGAQYIGMGQDIYNNFAAARAVFEEVSDSLGYDIAKIIFTGPTELLSQTTYTQPALMCVSMAVVRVIEELANTKIYELGDWIAGHSLGEYSALCAAGSLTLSDTAKLLNIRARAMQAAAPIGYGAMAAVINMPMQQLQSLLTNLAKEEVCQIANDNSATQIVISGMAAAVDRVISAIKVLEFKAIKLNVSAPFHSSLMRPATQAVEQALHDIIITAPSMKFIANVTANELYEPSSIKQALITQVEKTVRWRETIDLLEQQNVQTIIEIGAGQVLTNLIKKSNKQFNIFNLESTKAIENFLQQL